MYRLTRKLIIYFEMQLSNAQPVFKFELNHKVTPGIVIIAKYDGTHSCLTASAGYDKVRGQYIF